MTHFFAALAVILALLPDGEMYYRVSFYLNAGLYSDAYKAVKLARYVDDINHILAKNTNARLTFDPQDIYMFEDHPYEGGYLGVLPTMFEIDVYAEHADMACNGTSNTDPLTGDVVLDGGGDHRAMCWDQIYDPLAADLDVMRYWYQIETILHELGHGFGAGLPEYYWLAVVPDNTGQEPILDVNFWDPNDPYWSTHPGFVYDPMLRGSYEITTRDELLERVAFMPLTAHIINNVLRNGWETANRINIHVVDGDGNPVEGARVDIWTSPDNTIGHTTEITRASGLVSFEWYYPRINSVSSARLIKVYKDGLSAARFVTVLDSDIARLIEGRDTLEIDIPLLPGDPGHNCGPDHREGCVVPLEYNAYLPVVGR